MTPRFPDTVPNRVGVRRTGHVTWPVEARRLETGEYIASWPDCPGAWGTGATPEAAADELADVFREWLRV